MAVAYVGSADGRVEYGDILCGDALSSRRSGGLHAIRTGRMPEFGVY